jgi:hypothetical protein
MSAQLPTNSRRKGVPVALHHCRWCGSVFEPAQRGAFCSMSCRSWSYVSQKQAAIAAARRARPKPEQREWPEPELEPVPNIPRRVLKKPEPRGVLPRRRLA